MDISMCTLLHMVETETTLEAIPDEVDCEAHKDLQKHDKYFFTLHLCFYISSVYWCSHFFHCCQDTAGKL